MSQPPDCHVPGDSLDDPPPPVREASVSRSDLPAVVAVAFFLVALSCVPYVAGHLFTPPDRVFGGFVLDEIDANTYLAFMQQGARGQWMATLLYTPEDHPAILLYGFYLALGHLAAWLQLPLIVVYQIARGLSGLLLLVALYFFQKLFIRSRRGRWIGFLLAAIGSGVGWLVVLAAGCVAPGGVSPIDFWLMETYVFSTLLLFPHSTLAMALLMAMLAGLVICFTRRNGDDSTWRAWLAALLCGLLLTWLNPFALAAGGVALVGYWLSLWMVRRRVPWREAAALAALALLLAPGVVVLYPLQFDVHPVWRSFVAQNILPSPPVWYYVAGYGIIFLVALPGACHVLNKRDERQVLLVAWPAIVLLASYVPVSGQRRLVFGAVIPFAVLAAIGLQEVILPAVQHSRLAGRLESRGYDSGRLAGLAIALIVAFASLSNLVLLFGGSLAAASGQSDLSQPVAVEEAIAWLGERSRRDAVILSSFRVGNIIPARIWRRVVWGHWAETAFYEQKQADITAFFAADTPDSARQAILGRHGVTYLLYGPAERAMGAFDPAQAGYLEEVYRTGEVVVYRVVLGGE